MKDFIEIFTDDWPGRIMGVFLLGIILFFSYYFWYVSTHKCLKSHKELQYQTPPAVVVGGSKYGGGVAIPMGNARPVQVIVCDRYE